MPWETLNSHQFHSLLLICLLASSFLLGTNVYNHGNKSRGPLGLKMTEAQTVVQEWQSEHTQHLGRLPLCPGVTLPADTTLPQISFSAPQVRLCVGLGLHVPFCSGLRRFHHNLGCFQNVLTPELALPWMQCSLLGIQGPLWPNPKVLFQSYWKLRLHSDLSLRVSAEFHFNRLYLCSLRQSLISLRLS